MQKNNQGSGRNEMCRIDENVKEIRLVDIMKPITTLNRDNFKLIPQIWNDIYIIDLADKPHLEL